MNGRPFVKMHGLRNHFVIVDARDEPYRPAAEEIARLCDVQVGIGADQLIVIEPSASADAFMRIWNTDGREAEACGNATRCVAWRLLEERGGDVVVIETLAGPLNCERAGPERVRCGMGRVSRDWQRVPLAEKRDTLAVDVGSDTLGTAVACNVGNPHAVFFVDELDAVDVAALAPAIQRLPLFPEQVNVGVAQLVHEGRLRLVVYERGAGLTMACGSGACAAVYAARALGLTTRDAMTVALPGGELQIELGPDDTASMTGPVAYCFEGTLPAGDCP